MATFDYTGLTQSANNLLLLFGTTFTLNRTASTTTWTEKYNAVTGRVYWEDAEANIVYVAPTDTVVSDEGICVIETYENEDIDGTLIKQSDKKLIAKNTIEPASGDVFTVAGRSYQYVNHVNIAPDGNIILYEIQVRI